MFPLREGEQAPDPLEELELMRAYHAELLTDDRILPPQIRSLAGRSPEQVVAAMTDHLRQRGLPPGVMLRWRRLPRIGSQAQGALALDHDGMPILEGFTVVWRRKQRRRLADGTPIHGISAAIVGLIQLQGAGSGEASPAIVSIAPPVEVGRDSRTSTLRTRGGRPLNIEGARDFSEEEKTLGALVKRMRNSLPDTAENRGTLERLDRLMERVLTADTRYDLITLPGFQNIYTEITQLPRLDHKGRPTVDADGSTQSISVAYANHEFAALCRAMSFAANEEMSIPVDLTVKVSRKTRESAKEVEYMDLVSTRRLELHVRAEAQLARTAVATGDAPEVLVVNGRFVPPPSQWLRITQRVEILGGSTEVDIRVATMKGVALMSGASGGSAYFATGLEALTLLWSQKAPRRGEIAGLCRDCVDLKQRSATIKRSSLPKTKKMTGDGYTADKIQDRTHDGKPRKVGLTEELVNVLERWFAELERLSRDSGLTLPSSKSGSTVIFPTVTGRLIWRILDDLLGPVMERAGLASLPTHRSRHSLSTENKAMGVPEAVTSRGLGHTTSTDRLNYQQQPNDAALQLEADREMAWRRMIDKGATEKEVLGQMQQLG
jgi:hypothetical protein